MLLGPSIQVLPVRRMHIHASILAGLNHDSPIFKGFFILGWEF